MIIMTISNEDYAPLKKVRMTDKDAITIDTFLHMTIVDENDNITCIADLLPYYIEFTKEEENIFDFNKMKKY